MPQEKCLPNDHVLADSAREVRGLAHIGVLQVLTETGYHSILLLAQYWGRDRNCLWCSADLYMLKNGRMYQYQWTAGR